MIRLFSGVVASAFIPASGMISLPLPQSGLSLFSISFTTDISILKFVIYERIKKGEIPFFIKDIYTYSNTVL